MTDRTGKIVGVDVGGTFTDLFILDEQTGSCEVAKVPTTRSDQSLGIREGVAQNVASLADLQVIVHGTTVATNALLEKNGAKTGMIVTQGFRDVFEMRRRDRPRTWGLWGTYEPVIPRDMRIEVEERVLADGTLHTPVDRQGIEDAVELLLEKGAVALSIFFMNAYANLENERIAAEIARAKWPNPHVSVASEILPEIREFERCSTTALNAYLQPTVGYYLERLDTGLRDGGFENDILIVQSSGGVMSTDTARRLPVRTALSGPAAGVIAGAFIGTTSGHPNLITCDMGGTSFDVSLIVEGQSSLAQQTSIDFGMVIRSPMIEITTIGAGGGSIAWVDKGGILQIGPESAGSEPGPACYGLGNDRPTVTDANLLLGRINPDRPIGGDDGTLDQKLAARSIESHVAAPLGLDVLPAAEAIVQVANARMAGAIRLVSIERGHDPANFALMPFGGGGALHAGALIAEIGLARALIPRFPGVISALGCTIADMRFDRVQTLNVGLDQLDTRALSTMISELAKAGGDNLAKSGVPLGESRHQFELDMHYVGQTHAIAVSLPVSANGSDFTIDIMAIQDAFERTYRTAYGRLLENTPIRVLNVRSAAIGDRPKFDLKRLFGGTNNSTNPAPIDHRDVWIGGQHWSTPIFDRADLGAGTRLNGPAIIEQPDTTILIDPHLAGEVDEFGNLILEPIENG